MPSYWPCGRWGRRSLGTWRRGPLSRKEHQVSAELPLDEGPAPLSGNKAIEGAAIAFVMDLVRAAGREPVDRRYEAAFAADLESLPRIIDVKAVGGSQCGWLLRRVASGRELDRPGWLGRVLDPLQESIEAFATEALLLTDGLASLTSSRDPVLTPRTESPADQAAKDRC